MKTLSDIHDLCECPCPTLTREEKIAAGILFWARGIHMPLRERMDKGFMMGPSGFIHNNTWYPRPHEGCDAKIAMNRVVINKCEDKNSQKYTIYDKWALYKHSLSYEHCGFMVRHRFEKVSTHLQTNTYNLLEIFPDDPGYLIEKLPQLAFSKNWYQVQFAKDTLAGKNPWLFEMAETPAALVNQEIEKVPCLVA